MDIWTKIFLINWVLVLFIFGADKEVLGDAIEENEITGPVMGWWGALSLITVPVWLIHMIAKL